MVSATPETELVAVCSRRPEHASAVAADYGCDWVTDYRRLLDREDIDVIGVYTSTDLHYEIAHAAAQAGKSVVVSKPAEVDTGRAEEMVAAARCSGVRLVVEFDTHYQLSAYRIHRAIADGSFGPLIQGDYVNKCHRGQAYYDEAGGWRARIETGGGCVLNQGVHALDHLIWYQGEVEGVFAMSGTFAHDMPAEDAASAVIRFRNGSLATFTATTTFHNSRPAGRYGEGTVKRAEVHGRDGSATMLGDDVLMWSVHGSPDPGAELPEHPPMNVFQDLAWTMADPHYTSSTLVADDAVLNCVYLADALRRSADTGLYVEVNALSVR
jgi:UDP-N-acetyl-2-amino-2-deoxyglucuronate dehydrogenase